MDDDAQASQDDGAEDAEEARLDEDEDDEELGQDLVEDEDGSPTKATGGASGRAAPAAIGQSVYGFGRWRGAPQLPPPSQPLAANASSAPAAAERARGAALVAQRLPLPSLLEWGHRRHVS